MNTASNTAAASAQRLQRVLVALDFSDCTSNVVAQAIELAEEHGAELHLLHVVALPEGLDPSTVVRPTAGGPPVSGEDYAVSEARTTLARFTAQVEADSALKAEGHIVRGPVVETILTQAERLDVDTIVVGTHGRKGFHRWVMGSVAEGVSAGSPRPVVTIRPTHRAECDARSCSACTSAGTGAEELLRSELEG